MSTTMAIVATVIVLASAYLYLPARNSLAPIGAQNVTPRVSPRNKDGHRLLTERLLHRLLQAVFPQLFWDSLLLRVTSFAVVTIPIYFLLPMVPALGVTTVSGLLPMYTRYRETRRYEDRIIHDLVGITALLTMLASSGASLLELLSYVAENDSGPVGLKSAKILTEHRRGGALGDCFHKAEADEPAMRPLWVALRNALEKGSPIERQMRVLSAEINTALRLNAEVKARRAPTLMLFPLVFCILPAFILLTIVPLVASQLHELDGLFMTN